MVYGVQQANLPVEKASCEVSDHPSIRSQFEGAIKGSNLRKVHLLRANLSGADLEKANLSGADIRMHLMNPV